MSVIEVKNVTKRYGKKTALENVTLTFKENCIYGLLGRNGAGKSTLLNIIANRTYANEGEVLINGENAAENDRAQGRLHMMSEQLLYDQGMKVRDMFRAAALFYPDYDMEYALKLSEEYGLDIKKPLNKLSTGYRAIAKNINALACGADIIFFDEPVLGLDANHRDMFYRHVINRYSEKPATYVISTHLIEEAAGIIERAVVIKDGRVLLDEETETIKTMGYSVSGKASEVDSYISGKDVMKLDAIGGLKTAYIKGTPDNVPDSLEVDSLNLQTLFIHLTNS